MVTYYEIIKEMKSKINYRYHLVSLALDISVSHAAKTFNTTPKTVRKWRNRYLKDGIRGLEDQSRAPHRVHNKTSELDQAIIQATREKYSQWGPKRLISLAGLPYGHTAIYNTIKRVGLIKNKKKYQKKRDMRNWKKKHLKVFEKWQVDVKQLDDISEFFPYFKILSLPKYEFTARDIISGSTFIAFAHSANTTTAGIFIDYVISHLKYYGIDTSTIRFQYDNGSEFIGNVRKKSGRTPFEMVIDNAKAKHDRIPVASPTFNSDVETFHRLIEQEFYACESFENQTQFFAKALSYSLFFNYFRPNSYKDDLCPWQIVSNNFTNIDKNVLHLQPILLEKLTDDFIQGRYHVRQFPILKQLAKH